MALDLWIGDHVRLRSSDRLGIYLGKASDGRARININGKIIITKESNLEILPEKEQFFDIDAFLKDEDIKASKVVEQEGQKKAKLHNTLDLHIEVLAPDMKHLPSGQILSFQVERCRSFIEQNLLHGTTHITIIHGKGQGVLKAAIEALLTEFHQTKLTASKNHGGALDVWL